MATSDPWEAQVPQNDPWETTPSAMSTTPIKDVLSAVGTTLSQRPELQGYGQASIPQSPTNPVQGALSLATQTLASPIRSGVTAGQAQDVIPSVIAEEGGKAGYPKTAAGFAIAGAAIPYLAGIAGIYKGLDQTTNPVLKGLISTPQELGPQYQAQNEAIGVNRTVPVETSSRNPVYEAPERIAPTKQPKPVVPAQPLPNVVPTAYPSDTGAFLKYANNKLASGNPINPQELMDWQVKLQTDMSNGNIPKFVKDPGGNDTSKITTAYQQASDLSSRASKLFNQLSEKPLQSATLPSRTIPTRSGLNQANTIANQQQNIRNGILKGLKYGGEGLVGTAGLGGLYEAYKKITGK